MATTRSTRLVVPATQSSSDDTSDSDASLLPPKPKPIEDEDGFTVALDPGEVIDQEKIDHSQFLELAQDRGTTGWLPMVELAGNQEADVCSSFMTLCSKRDWLSASDSVLATVEPLVLDAITMRYGNLNQLVANNQQVRAMIAQNEKRGGKDHPSVYVRALTHDDNDSYNSFTVDEAIAIAENALAYASEHDSHRLLAFRVDRKHNSNWPKVANQNGELYFLQTKKNGPNDPTRIRQLKTFARVLKKIAYECIKKQEPTVPVMHYVGYAVNAPKRKQQHDLGGSNSNWLIQCVVAIANSIGYSTFITSHTVALINEEMAGPVAEMLLTRISRAYYFAGGFSLGQAGASVASIHGNKMSGQEFEDWWKSNQEYIKKTEWTDRLDVEIELRQKHQAFGITAQRLEKTKLFKDYKQDIARIEEGFRKGNDIVGTDLEARDRILGYMGEQAGIIQEIREYLNDVQDVIKALD